MLLIVTNISTSAYVFTVLNSSDRDLLSPPNHMCLLSVNAMTPFLGYFEIRIMPDKIYLIKNDYAKCSLLNIAAHCRSVKGVVVNVI